MKHIAIILLVFFSKYLFAKEYTLGPLKLELSDEYYIENNEEDVLLGFSNESEKGPYIHFNIQLGEIAINKSEEYRVSSQVKAIASEIDGSKYSKGVTEDGYQFEKVGGTRSIDSEHVNIYAAEIIGEKYIVYFVLIDGRPSKQASEFFNLLYDTVISQEI